MSNEARTLVMGTACGYEVEQAWVFVESLRRHYSGPAALLVSSDSSQQFFEFLISRRISPVLFDCAAWMLPHVQFTRFVRYGEVLRTLDCDSVLLSDVGDVLFQGGPFAGMPAGELLCFMESPGRTIGSCGSNSLWIAELYGFAALERLRVEEISCSGTVMGTRMGILEYIRRLTGHVRPEQFLPLTGKKGHDQGVHNALLHTGQLPGAVKVSNGAHVFTVGMEKDELIRLEGEKMVSVATGRAPPIVHQYNYKPRLGEWVKKLYPMRG